MFRFSLALWLFLAVNGRGELLLSEVMADPAAVPDASGEYLELGNAGEKDLHIGELVIKVGENSLILYDLTLPAGGVALLCRDSLPDRNGGMACDKKAEGLQLANGRALSISLKYGERESTFEVPPSKSGQSWENTWDGKSDFSDFAISRAIFAGGDKGSPGHPNSVSVVPPLYDLAITEVDYNQETMMARVRIENRGRRLPESSSISLLSDNDLDGIHDVVTQAHPLDVYSCEEECFVAFRLEEGKSPLWVFALSRDANPLNDTLAFMLPGMDSGELVKFTEICAAPTGGAPEWVELRNMSPHSLELSALRLQGRPIIDPGNGSPFLPGEYLVITEDENAFRAVHGNLKLRLLQMPGWKVLRNTGDTVRLTLASGAILDSVAYGGIRLSEKTGCLERVGSGLSSVPGESHAMGATPGYEENRNRPTSWKVSPRILRADKGGRIDVQVTASAGRTFKLEIFDLTGHPVRALCDECAGSRSFSWEGEDDKGRVLPIGPYILLFQPQGGRSQKKSVVISRSIK